VKRAKEYVGDQMAVCTVIGFPNGYNTTEVKAFETRDALANGADEIGMVINMGDLKAAGGISSFHTRRSSSGWQPPLYPGFSHRKATTLTGNASTPLIGYGNAAT
jgi:hypothetical protein